MTVKLYASIRPSRPDSEEPTVVEIHGEGEDYEAAKAALEAQATPGWQVLGYSRWPGSPQRG